MANKDKWRTRTEDQTGNAAIASMYGVEFEAARTHSYDSDAPGTPNLKRGDKSFLKRILKADKKSRRKKPDAPN